MCVEDKRGLLGAKSNSNALKNGTSFNQPGRILLRAYAPPSKLEGGKHTHTHTQLVRQLVGQSRNCIYLRRLSKA